jgi:parallel beta-helix repeat protein
LPEEPLAGDPVTFNASNSYDYDGYIANYTWDFGDGNITVVSDAVLVHVYASRGLYNVNLTLTDNDGNSCSATKLVIARSEICVPDDYQTVQEAINAAISRDTIFVRNGTYPEDVEINKSVSLLGEERTATLIDGTVLITESKVVLSGFTVQGSLRIGDLDRATKNVTVNRNIVSNGGILMSAPASLLPNYPLSPVLTNNTVSNNFITNSTHGISLQGWGTNNTVSGNIVTNNEAGIVLRGQGNNTIVNNVVSGNVFGMWLESRNNMLRNNTMTDNQYNFVTDIYHLWGTAPVNNVDTSNTVNGKPVYLLINKSDMFIDPSSFPDVGYLALINCYNVTVRNLRLTNNSQGILISNSANIIIAGNTLKNNMIALTVKNVNDTSFENNTIIENLHGVFFSSGFNNTIIDNTLSNNTIRLLPYRWPERWPLPPLSTWIRELIWYSGGIFFYDCSNNTIANNILLNNERGIYLSASSLNMFENNTMVGNLYNFGIESGILIPQEWVINPPSKPQISPNMIVKDLTLQKNEQGILLFDTTNTTISNSTITESRFGIEVKSYYFRDVPLTNKITENNITKNGVGISIENGGNKVSRNVFKLNLAGVYVRADDNLITENKIDNNTLPPTEQWILGYQPPHCEPVVWGFALGPAGIILEATNNTICYNTIQDNEYGMSIGLLSCNGGNIIHHNNFINNTMHGLVGTINTWEGGYPSGGNYWSDYEGVDAYNGPYQNETGSDGIGDTAYFVGKWVNLVRACSSEALSQWDQYPLMAPVSLFDAGTWNSVQYNVHVVSNSTISGFHFDPQEGAFLRFNVTGRNGTTGFCRVTIPKDLLWVKDGWIVTVNDSPVDYTIVSDQNHTYMCFNYTHSTKTVKITGTHVIPEFQSLLIIPLFMIATLLAVIAYGRKHSNGKEYS